MDHKPMQSSQLSPHSLLDSCPRGLPRDSKPVSDQIWEAIKAEFALPSLGQVSSRMSELMEDPEPVMQQLVRVFLSGLVRLGTS